jgi:hypothetical protein
MRADGAVIIGRKGSGKSAVFFEVVEELSRNRKNCIVDLRPASHNLSEMRESLLNIISIGVFDHTIHAFWQYVMYVEILLKIREMVLPRSRNSFPLQERIRAVENEFELNESVVSGDFTSRLDLVIGRVLLLLGQVSGADEVKNRLTNVMFEVPIHRMRDAIISFGEFYDQICLLFDDLDKGWPSMRVQDQDISMVKHLIEALNRIQRDFKKRRVRLKHLVFLRSDVYERLVEHTADRGKYNVIKVDWSEPEQLRHLLKRRVVSNFSPEQQESAWACINSQLDTGEDAVNMMITNSLRRPRILVDLCERALSFAIKCGRDRATIRDVEEGLRQMSLYLVSDFGYEMRDVAGTPEYIFYAFIGVKEVLTETEIGDILASQQIEMSLHEVIELLLWYGFLGICEPEGTPVFIYDRGYDFRRLLAESSGIKGELLYAVNPAFLRGLEKR